VEAYDAVLLVLVTASMKDGTVCIALLGQPIRARREKRDGWLPSVGAQIKNALISQNRAVNNARSLWLSRYGRGVQIGAP
jgi:hypothetical protein